MPAVIICCITACNVQNDVAFIQVVQSASFLDQFYLQFILSTVTYFLVLAIVFLFFLFLLSSLTLVFHCCFRMWTENILT